MSTSPGASAFPGAMVGSRYESNCAAWRRLTPALVISLHARPSEPPASMPPRRVLDHDGIEAGALGVEGGPRDAEVGGEPGEVDALQSALLEITGEARHGLAVGLEERGVRVDVLAIAIADDELGVRHPQLVRELRVECSLDAVVGPQNLRSVRKLDRFERLLAGMARSERRVSGRVPVLGH